MPLTRELAKQALRALEKAQVRAEMYAVDNAIDALRAALAEPEPEPVIWADLNEEGEIVRFRYYSDGNPDEVALYDVSST